MDMRVYELPGLGDTMRKTYGVETTDGKPVAHCFRGISEKDAKANAHLLAASYDLREALKACRSELDMIHSQYGTKARARYHSAALVMADNALLKAEPI